MSRGINEYKNNQPHVELCKKILKREPTTNFLKGDRINFVYINTKEKKKTMAAEDPIYVVKNRMQIDVHRYVNDQLKKPLEKILTHIMKNIDELFIIKKITYNTPKISPLLKFTKIVQKCLYCKERLGNDQGAVCKNCEDKKSELYFSYLEKHKEIGNRCNFLMNNCKKCQGELLSMDIESDVVPCGNNSCEFFYERDIVKINLEENEKILERFNINR